MVTPLYAAVLALAFVALSVRTLLLRRSLGIALGDGGDEQMLRATRAHGNFVEYVPITLLVLFMGEQLGTGTGASHLLGSCLLIGRALHAFGVSRVAEDFRLRVAGMALTFVALIGGSVRLLMQVA